MAELTLNWNQVQHELRNFVYKKVRDKALAEDIVHDVFLKVQDKIQQLRDGDKVFGWIYQIARNTIIDHYRKNSRTIKVSDIHWDSNSPNFNDCVTTVLQELIQTLPDKYRIPLELAEIQNMSQVAIAERLNLTYTAAKARVQRARQMLKRKIDEVLFVKTDGYGNVILCKDRFPCC